MPSYREILAPGQAPRSTRSTPPRARERLEPADRRSSSTSASATSGTRAASPARSTSRAATSSRGSSSAVPDRSQPIVLYCAGGNRSAFAAKTLGELGYENVVSLAGGFTDWKRNGFPIDLPTVARPRAARALQPPPADPRGRRGGPAQAARLARAAARRRRARLARGALPRGGRRRQARDRRRRRRRRRRTSSARSCTRPRALGEPKADSARRDDRGAQPRRRGRRPTASGSRPRTSTGSSATAGT